ncbi:ATP-dependent Clp protease proteolytic subunit [Patescibacteria group bacterium AH-259-L07]|nr:ATP-dependent Clp protease proteolytic subunit [Patescibacteria group bacterium AH-259-L07]
MRDIKREVDLLIVKAKAMGPQKPKIGRSISVVDITPESALRVMRELDWCDNHSPFEEIRILLNSDGGYLIGTHAICRVMNQCRKPIEVRSYQARSAAALILASGIKGRRSVYKGSEVAIRQGISVESLPKYINYLLSRSFARLDGKLLSKRTGQPMRKILDDIKKKTQFSAEEAVAYGLADRVVAYKRICF